LLAAVKPVDQLELAAVVAATLDWHEVDVTPGATRIR
jgi:hypothetical protein